MTGEHFDSREFEDEPADRPTPGSRRFVGVNFACCGVYSRIYTNRQQTAYVGNCPKCGKRVQLAIGPGGSDSRFFTAY